MRAEAQGGELPAAEADRVWQRYEQRWTETDDYAASFQQRIEVSGVGSQVESAGRFYFARPDRMRWEYLEGPPQTVVGDGRFVWIYQPDLEQAYRIDYQTAFGSGGLVALLGDRKRLGERYDVSLAEGGEGAYVIRLAPREATGDRVEVKVSADTFDLVEVTVTDPAGTVTHMWFSDIRRNEGVEAASFTFTPPAGVDIIITAADS